MKSFVVSILIVTVIALSSHSFAAQRNERDFVGATYYAYVVNCNVAVSLRYAPDTSSACIIEIPLGTKVEVLDGPANVTINGFLPVKYNGYNGYILADYLEAVPWSGGVAKP